MPSIRRVCHFLREVSLPLSVHVDKNVLLSILLSNIFRLISNIIFLLLLINYLLKITPLFWLSSAFQHLLDFFNNLKKD